MKANPSGIVFATREIQRVLGEFSLERVKYALRENAVNETNDNGLFEFLDAERNVRLTSVGRAWCQQHGLCVSH
jgi:predicted transcriptional regulator